MASSSATASETPYKLFTGSNSDVRIANDDGDDDEEYGVYEDDVVQGNRKKGMKEKVEVWRLTIKRWNESLPWHVLILILVLLDAGILIHQLATGRTERWGVIAGNVILGIFVLDVILRVVAFGRQFFSSILNIYDFIIVSLSLLLAFLTNMGQYLVIGRLVSRSILLILKLQQQKNRIPDATRKIISENKMRFQEDGFDLDLAYVTPRCYYRFHLEKLVLFKKTKQKLFFISNSFYEG